MNRRDTIQEVPQTDGYGPLRSVLDEALNQARSGKGNERHSTGQPFLEQPIMTIGRRYGHGFNLGQAEKKMQESLRMEKPAAVRELLGAINYIASAILLLEDDQ